MWIDKEGYINFKLKNIDTFSLPANKCIYAHCVFALRNTQDFSCFKGKYNILYLYKFFKPLIITKKNI